MQHRARRLAAIAALATISLLVGLPGLAAAASSRQTSPRPGLGVIDMVQRMCNGSSYGWQRVAADNGVKGPNYIVYADRKYNVTCYKPGSAGSTSKPSTKPTKTSPSAWVNPLPHSTCISGWGAARIGHSHHGLDLVSSAKYVVAIARGVVVFNGYESGGAGYYVKVRHSKSLVSVYMHLASRPGLDVGDVLNPGDIVGRQGGSGDADGRIHLHFELRRTVDYGTWFNPAPTLRAHGIRIGC